MSLVRFLKTGAAVVDPHSMTELTATVQTLTPDAPLLAPRDLTSHEQADLERLRAPLAGPVDRTDPRAVSWFWDRVVPAQPGVAAPGGLVEWVGVALGDLLVTHVAGARWVVCPGPFGPTLGVVGTARPLAPVVPLPDVQDRWTAGARGWIAAYLGSAAAHLADVNLPQQRPSSENLAAPASAEPSSGNAPAAVQDVSGPAVLPGLQDPTEPSGEWAPVVAPAAGHSLPSRGHGHAAADPVAPTAVPAAEWVRPTAEQHATDPIGSTHDEHTPEPIGTATDAPAAATVRPTADEHVPAPALASATVTSPAPQRAAQPSAQRPTHLPHPPSAAAQDLALRALEHALVVLRRGPFDREAFVMLVDDSGTRTLACTGEPSQALRQARDTARTSGARTAAIGWIDRHPTDVPDPRQGFPAVLVEASEAGAPGLRVAHRFVEDALGTGPLGDPVLVGEVPALL